MVSTTTAPAGNTEATRDGAADVVPTSATSSARVGIRDAQINIPDSGESCNWEASGDVTPSYFIDLLASVDVKGQNQVSCSPGLIDYLFNHVTAQKDEADIGNQGTAPDCTAPSCNGSTATVEYYCGLDENAGCAGKYRLHADFTLVLQPPYYWPGPAGAGCTIGGANSERLTCDYFTNEVTVSPLE